MTVLNFDTLNAMLDYFEDHEDECDMWVAETRAYLSEKGDCKKPISNEIFDQKCFVMCFGERNQNERD